MQGLTEGTVVVGLMPVCFKFGSYSAEAREPFADEAAVWRGEGREALVEGGPVNVGAGAHWKTELAEPVGANPIALEIGGEVIREVAGDEVVGDPNAMSLKGKDRESWRGLKILKVIAEGFCIVISKNVELFRTGEFVEL